MLSDCIFCKIINKKVESYIIFEDNDMVCILDVFPANKGHILVIPKIHVVDIFSLEKSLGAKLFSKTTELAKCIKTTFGTNNINIIQNNGPIAGQSVNHFHIHIIPRFENDNFIGIHQQYEPLQLDNKTFTELRDSIKINLS